MAKHISDLPHTRAHGGELPRLLDVRSPAVLLDYDGTLTPIANRPEDAAVSHGMRRTVRELTGRDSYVRGQRARRADAAGAHGPRQPHRRRRLRLRHLEPGGTVEREEGSEFEALLDGVKTGLHEELDPTEGALVEPKITSVAAHYRLVSDEERLRVRKVAGSILAEHPEELRIMPGKMVYEIQPKIEWDEGRAMLYLLKTLDLGRDGVVPVYLGDDVTEEDASEALADHGVGIFVDSPDDPEVAQRTTAADYILLSTEEVRQSLDTLAR
jgi:trehalose 6-phosphate phosphatase